MEVRINQQLATWLVARARARAPLDEIHKALAAHGFAPGVVERLYADAVADPDAFLARLRDTSSAAAAPAPVPPARPAQPLTPTRAAEIAFQPTAFLPPGRRFACDHGPVEVAFRLARPHVAVLHDLLTDEECDALIAEATPALKRAMVVDSAQGGSKVDTRRTSELTTLRRGSSALVARIDARIAALTGIAAEQGEDLQVMRYGVGAEYQPHHDYFREENAGEAALLANGGQRIASLVMYLNDVEEGGETVFPLVGLAVSPRRGSGVYFAYTDAGGQCDRFSLHGGAPVQAGEKWIATRWFRASAFR